ncbi:MAG TPA: dihydrofolate reductase family protein [Actinomycetota bacterium]|nr:dihydrofolate reductase family protein [Actinomycetota bacterium]
MPFDVESMSEINHRETEANMGKLVVTEYISLDGVFEEPGEWSIPFFSDDAGEFKDQELFASDAQLLGRLTYEGFARAWPTMEDAGDFGVRMNTMPKYVISKTLENPDWENTTVIRDDIAGKVAELKGKYQGDILVAGSGQLVRLLLEHDLVDEVRFMVHPLIVGEGKKLFSGEWAKKVFELRETRPLESGIVLLFYVRKEG